MANSIILWTFLGLIITFVAKYLMDAGVFRHIEPKGSDQCQLLVPSDGGSFIEIISILTIVSYRRSSVRRF